MLSPLPLLVAGSTSVRVTDDVRADRAAHVRTGEFEGPLALLLSLIEQRRLDILSVPLGELAGAYLEAIVQLEGDQVPHISGFVTVASQLILIKSRALLPREPAPGATAEDASDPEEALRARLVEYRRFRDAALLLTARAASGLRTSHREPSAAQATARAVAVAPRPRPLDPTALVRALVRSVQMALPLEEPPEVVVRTITLVDRARVIREALAEAPALVLQDLLHGVTDRVVVAITFLAMLELVKGRELVVDQSEPWGPISIRRRMDADGAGAAEPQDPDGDDG